MEFADRLLLLLALLVIPAALLLWFRRRERSYAVPSAVSLTGLRPTLRQKALLLLPGLRIVAILLLVVALARPRSGDAEAIVPSEGIDIAISLDLSSSMEVAFGRGGRSRLDVTKDVVREFIKGRQNDRIGLVVFRNDAFAVAPPSLDYDALDIIIRDFDAGFMPDGTGIGVGLASALTMLQDSTAASRIVILLTDGEHNAESIRPEAAAELAASLRIRVYTIGVVDDVRRVRGIDEPLLRHMATSTGGRYFVADSGEDLAEIYQEISLLETSRISGEQFERFHEYGPWLLAAAAALILLEIALRATWLRRPPA
jgi:Ca-activated chloride channel homolog